LKEYITESRADLILVQTRLHAIPSGPVGKYGDIGGVLDGGDFRLRFPDAVFGDEGTGVGDLTKGNERAELFSLRLARQRVDFLGELQSLAQLRFQLLDGHDLVEACDLLDIRVFGRGAVSVEDFAALVVV